MKKLLSLFLVFTLLLVGCGGGGGGGNPAGKKTEDLIINESFLLGKKWFVVRGSSSSDINKEIEVVLKKGSPSNIICYEFISNGKVNRTTILVDENLDFIYGAIKTGEYHITDGILYATFETSTGAEDRKGVRINDEIKFEYNNGSHIGHYSILATSQPRADSNNSTQQTNHYINNPVTASMLLGTWEHSKESNPENYSQLLNVKKSPNNSYISKIVFKSDGQAVTTNYEMTLTAYPNSSTPYEWITDDTSGEVVTEKYTVSDNRLYVTDLNGNNGYSVHVESNGTILYFIADNGSVSQYIKK